VAQPMAVETVRMPQNAANRTIDRDRILARRGLRLQYRQPENRAFRIGDTRTQSSSIGDHFRTGSGSEASATPRSSIRTPILGQVNLLGARRGSGHLAAPQNWTCAAFLASVGGSPVACLATGIDGSGQVIRRSVKYRVGGDGSHRRNPEDPVARRVGHSWEVTAPTPCAFPPPSAIRRAAPITRSEARYR